MYTPGHFKVLDQSLLHQFMRQFSFATLISFRPQPQISHLPFVVRTEPTLLLVSHMARAPHGYHLPKRVNHAYLSGPHAYVSPLLLKLQIVPTWNYSSYPYGIARVRE